MNCSVCCEHHNVSTSFFSVFPAGAGVIRQKEVKEQLEAGFPRRCGGDPEKGQGQDGYAGFSPQVRG